MLNVLIVDDLADNRTVLYSLLQEVDGIKIYEATNGQEAIDSCKIVNMDLVFMDIMMPQMNGYDATSEIKKQHKDTMIIALSALDNDEARDKMLHRGAEDYITKPINPDLFLSRFSNYINILQYRKLPVLNSQAKNPFSKHIFSRFTQFNIHNEHTLAEFWDYFLNASEKDIDDLIDYIRIVFALGQKILEKEEFFSIIHEENQTHMYLIQSNMPLISKSALIRVMEKYLPKGGRYALYQQALVLEIPKNIVKESQKKDSNITLKDKISAKEFLETTPFDFMDRLDIMEDLELQIDKSIMDLSKSGDYAHMQILMSMLDKYGKMISLLPDFNHLGIALESMAQYLGTIELEKIDDEKKSLMIKLLTTFLDDISSWRVSVFLEQSTVDIHYMDDSMLNACLMLEAMLEEVHEDEGDIEFF